MSDQIEIIKRAIARLSNDTERGEIKIFTEDYIAKTYDGQQETKKLLEAKNYSVGPTSSSKCPICGR